MNCLADAPLSTPTSADSLSPESAPSTGNADPSRLLNVSFVLGWTSASETLLPKIPQLLAQWLKSPQVRLQIVHWNGQVEHDYVYVNKEITSHQHGSAPYEFMRPLGRDLNLTITLQPSETPISISDSASLHQVLTLLHHSLESALIQQNDRKALGEPYLHLSPREWRVCLALEGPEPEKQIADQLKYTKDTLHTFVKGVYRKTKVQSRMESVHRLRQARDKVRQQTLEMLSAPEDAAILAPSST